MSSTVLLVPAGALVLALVFSNPASAQQAQVPNAPGPQWNSVQALTLGTPIIVRSGSRDVTCKFNHAASDTLSCVNPGIVELERSSISEVETYNRPASTAVLAATGAVIGIATVSIVSAAMGERGSAKGSVFAGGAAIGAFIFYPIGYFTHPIHHTVYRAQ